MQPTLKIPKSFSSYCLTNKVVEAKTYIYLKMICSGKIRLSNEAVDLACKELSISKGTFYRHLNLLKDRDWVGYSQQSKIYFIRSFQRIYELENLEGKTCTIFSKEWFKTFKAFLSGSVIGYLVKHQRKSERKKRRSSQTYKDVATKALSKILNIPESTAYELKQIAHKEKFIHKKRAFKDTGVHISYLTWYRKANPEVAHKAIGLDDKVQLCMPDKVKGLLQYKTNKHLRVVSL